MIKVTLKPDEPDHFGHKHNVEFTRLLDENHSLTINIVEKYITIPISKLLHHIEGVIVLKMIEGVDLDEMWERVSPPRLEIIELELREYIQQLWFISNSSLNEFVVGTLFLDLMIFAI